MIAPRHPVEGGPVRLWSLWEMLRVYAKPFVEASELFGQLTHVIRDPHVSQFEKATVTFITDKIDLLVEQLDGMNLAMTKKSVLKLRTHVNAVGVTPGQCRDYLHEAMNRLSDEVEISFLLSLSSAEAQLFESSTPHFGDEVDAAFPCASYDIDEAAKCLALGRTTASAFHSIRCLEASIRAISRCLGIPDPTKANGRNWGAMLKAVKENLDRRWSTSDRLSGDGQIFEEIYVSLASIQNPWRNATMHMDHKYTAEEAAHVFEIVGALMKRVASRCDEDGNPQV